MKFIKGMTFAPFIRRGDLMREETLSGFDSMVDRTDADFVITVPNGLHDTLQSEKLDFTSDATVSDEELEAFIDYARSKGLRTALKPTVNCRNGSARAENCHCISRISGVY